VRPGTTSDALVSTVDFHPTLLEMAGVDPPAADVWPLDGRSFVPVLEGRAGPEWSERAVFDFFPHAGRLGRPPSVAVRRGRWKLIHRYETPPGYAAADELYDLEADLGETANRAAERPDRVAALTAEIDHFLEDTDALVPKPNPRYDPSAAGAAGAGAP
jgi:arylsulfatase A-like enzyme